MDGPAAARGQAQCAAPAAPKKFDPSRTRRRRRSDPFSTQKLAVALKQEARQPNSAAAARPEPPQGTAGEPTRSTAWHGGQRRQGRAALCAVARRQALLYQVKVGDYLGQNYGRITKITRPRSLRRSCNAAGEWIERPPRCSSRRGRDENIRSTPEVPGERPAGRLCRRAVHGRPAALGADDDPVDHQHAAGGRGGGPHRAERSACRRHPPASRSSRHRAWPSTCRTWQCAGRNSGRINQGNLRSVNVARPVSAPAWCSTSSRLPASRPSCRARPAGAAGACRRCGGGSRPSRCSLRRRRT
jgi:Tfp pilus assembly protein PilP